MANYIGSWRSNYFKVKDLNKFKEWINTIEAELHTKDDYVYLLCPAFSDSGSIPTPEDEHGDELDFYKEVSKHLKEGEVAIFQEVGAEKLRYLVGYSIAVNHEGQTVEVTINDVYQKVKEEFGVEPTRAETY